MSQKKKILIFIDWFLPGYKAGGPVRSMANMIDYLKDDFRFYIVTRNTDYTESIAYSNVKSNCWEDFSTNVKVYYGDGQHQNKRSYEGLIEEVKPDLIYINGVYSWKYSILPLLVSKRLKAVKVVVAARGMLAQSAINVKGSKKRLFLKLAKYLGFYQKVVFHATNKKEQADIQAVLGGDTPVVIADNLPKRDLPASKPIVKIENELRLVSLARIAPEKNTLYALERLKDLGAIKGRLTLDLYGQVYDEAYWNKCQSIIQLLPGNIKVEYRGTVEADQVTETIQGYHMLFMPTRGENFGHVILESLSAGRPVLISDQTPWRGLEKDFSGMDLALPDQRAFSEALSVFMGMQQEDYDKWCAGARRRAVAFIENHELKHQYHQLFNPK